MLAAPTPDPSMRERSSSWCARFTEVIIYPPLISPCLINISAAGRPLPQVFWYVDDQAVPGRTHTEPGKDVVVNRLRYSTWVITALHPAPTKGSVRLHVSSHFLSEGQFAFCPVAMIYAPPCHVSHSWIVTDISPGLHCFPFSLCPCHNNCLFVSPRQKLCRHSKSGYMTENTKWLGQKCNLWPSSLWNPSKQILILSKLFWNETRILNSFDLGPQFNRASVITKCLFSTFYLFSIFNWSW